MDPSEGDLPAHDSDASLDDDAPQSAVRPSLAPGHPPQPGGDAPPAISDQQLRDLVAQRSVQDTIRRIVGARVERGSPAALVDDLVQEATVAVLTAKSRPSSMETAAGWVSTVTVRTVANHYRRDQAHRTWLDREADVEQQPGEPEEAPEDGWLVAPWLAPILEHHPADRETYELLVHKARTGKAYRDLAAEHGITVSALKSRVHEFKKRYEPRWRRRQTMFALLLLLGAAAVALVVWLAWRLARPAEIRPDPSPASPRSAPSATASAPDNPFDPALPPVRPPDRTPQPDEERKPPGPRPK